MPQPPSVPVPLARLREQIDAIDDEIVGLLARRADVVRSVAEFKEKVGLPTIDERREEQQLERIGAVAADHGLEPRVARHVLRAMIDAFTRVEADHHPFG
jgi:chorismate mutase